MKTHSIHHSSQNTTHHHSYQRHVREKSKELLKDVKKDSSSLLSIILLMSRPSTTPPTKEKKWQHINCTTIKTAWLYIALFAISLIFSLTWHTYHQAKTYYYNYNDWRLRTSHTQVIFKMCKTREDFLGNTPSKTKESDTRSRFIIY